MDGLKSNLKHAASNLAKLGDVYSQLSGCYSEIERWNRPELVQISPKLGDLYNTLKNSVFQLSNTYGKHSNIFSKFFERTLQDVFEHSNMVCEVRPSDLETELAVRGNQETDLLRAEGQDREVGASEPRHQPRYQAEADECWRARVDSPGLQHRERVHNGHDHQPVRASSRGPEERTQLLGGGDKKDRLDDREHGGQCVLSRIDHKYFNLIVSQD